MEDLDKLLNSINEKIEALEAESSQVSNVYNLSKEPKRPGDLANYLFEEYVKTKNPDTLSRFIYLLKGGKINSLKPNINPGDDISIFFEIVEGNTNVLEYIIINDITMSFGMRNVIRTNIDLLKIMFKYDKYNILEYADEKTFLLQIDDMTLLEYLFAHDLIIEQHIVNINSRILIDLCIKYNRLDILSCCNQNLLFLDYDDNKKVIDLLFENDLVDKSVISRVYSNKSIIEYCNKYNRRDLLAYLNESLLSRSIDDNSKVTILEKLLDEGVEFKINFNSIELIKIIIDRGKEELLTNISTYVAAQNIEPGKTIFESLLEKNIIVNNAINDLQYLYNKHSKTIFDVLVKNKRYDLLLNCKADYYLEKIDGDKTLIQVLIENNYFPINNYFNNEELAELFFNLGLYDKLDMFYIEILIKQSPSGLSYLEEYIKRGYKLNSRIVTSHKEMVDMALKYDRYDLVENIHNDLLVKPYKINETYLDIFLQKYCEGYEMNITQPFLFGNPKTNAKIYLIYAKYDLVSYLPTIEKENLLEEDNKTRLIDELLKGDKELVAKVIPNNVKEDFEIAMILRLNGIDQKEIKNESVTRDFLGEYLDSFYKEYGEYFLDSDTEDLIMLFRVLMSDGKSKPEYVEAIIKSYRHLFYINSPYKAELLQLIKLKKLDPTFSIKTTDSGAFYSSINNSIYMDDSNVETINHEMGHALFHNLSQERFPEEEFTRICDKLAGSEEFLNKVKEYSEKYLIIKSNVEKYVDDNYMNEYDKSITEEKKKEIEEFLLKSKEEKKKIYLDKGYDEELLNTILDRTFSIDEYLEQDKRVIKKELIDLILRTQYSEFIAIGDYFDGIYKGKFRDNKLTDSEGKTIQHAYGHGISYYARGKEYIYDEMLANYSEIMKSKNPEKGIEMLRYFIGDEIVDLVSNYYNKEILQSTKLEEEKNVSL